MIVLGSLAAQNDSAESHPTAIQDRDTPAYLYMDFGTDPSGSGLMTAFRDPSTRAAVVTFLEERIGDVVVAEALIAAADRHQVDPALIVAVSWQESRFRATAAGVNTNSSIDRGLMQLNSSTFTFLTEEDFYNPYLNADYGASYLRQTLDLSGNTVAALAMYNAGPGRVGSLGAPRMTLDYIDHVFAYRNELVWGFYEDYGTGSVLMTRDIKPVKNPDYL